MSHSANAFFAFDQVQQLTRSGVPGAIVECGVFRGGVTAMMMLAHLASGSPPRQFWLYDTFDGMTRPDPKRDGDLVTSIYDNITRGVLSHAAGGVRSRRWSFGGRRDEVARNLASTGYPCERIHYVEGKVEETLRDPNRALPSRIAMLRLDTDWYESTKAELEVLVPRLSPRGIVVLDDYFHFKGSGAAADEFWGSNLTRIGRTLAKRRDGNVRRDVNFHLVRSNIPFGIGSLTDPQYWVQLQAAEVLGRN